MEFYPAVVSSGGRVVVPKPVRDRLGLAPGAAVFFIVDGDEVRLARSPEDAGGLMALYGGGFGAGPAGLLPPAAGFDAQGRPIGRPDEEEDQGA